MADFLEIDPTALSDSALQELIRSLAGSEKHRENLRTCQRELATRAMKGAGLTHKEMIRELCRSTTLETRKAIAKEWAPIFEISESDFLKIAGFRQV